MERFPTVLAHSARVQRKVGSFASFADAAKGNFGVEVLRYDGISSLKANWHSLLGHMLQFHAQLAGESGKGCPVLSGSDQTKIDFV